MDRSSLRRNSLLAILDREHPAPLSVLSEARLAPGTEPYSPGLQPSRVYFPLNRALSLLLVVEEDTCAEAALIGPEGMLGFPTILEPEDGHWRAVAVLPTDAVVVDALRFAHLLADTLAFRAAVERYSATLFRLSVQLAGCGRFHTVVARLARFLLMLHDQSQGRFHLTHDVLAQILGSHRPTITRACTELRELGLVDYRRAEMSVVDRTALEAVACACYPQTRAAVAQFQRSCQPALPR
jgi:CRP-like cAMP-binding protein